MIDVQTRNYSNLQLELGIEVPRGTQFFQVFIREDSVESNDWGGDGVVVQYEIFIDYSEIDEEMSRGSHQVTKQSSGVIL